MKTLLLAGKKSWVFEIEDSVFEQVKYAMRMYFLLWRRPSQDSQIKFLEDMGFKKRLAKLTNGSKIMFAYLDEQAEESK